MGERFPPVILYSTQLLGAVDPGKSAMTADVVGEEYGVNFGKRSHHRFSILVAPGYSSRKEPFSSLSGRDLADVISITSRQQQKLPRKASYRQREARRLRKTFGLDLSARRAESEDDCFLASEASDLNQFIELMSKPDTDSLNAELDRYFDCSDDREQLNALLNEIELPESQFL